MDETRRAMLLIKTLDNDAALLLSEWTGQWYINANIEVSNSAIISGVTEHRYTPEEAIMAFLDRLKSITLDEVIVAHPTGERRHYRWNGAAFVEQYDSRLARAVNVDKETP